MPGIVTLVNAISADVVAALAVAGYPPLTAGKILLGSVHLGENLAPPAVIFVPKSSRFEAPQKYKGWPSSPQNAQYHGAALRTIVLSNYGGGYSNTPTVAIGAPPLGTTATAIANVVSGFIRSVVITNPGSGYIAPPIVTISDSTGTGATAIASVGPAPDQIAQLLSRSLRTDVVLFEVHCWGVATPPDPDNDFDFTQTLYQQVIRSTHLLAPGSYDLDAGDWTDASANRQQVLLYGHEFVFGLSLRTPLLDSALSYAPVGVQPSFVVSLQPPGGGTPEQG